MKKTSSILIILLILSIVGIAGCTSSDDTTYTSPDNYTDSNSTPVEPTNTKNTDTEDAQTDKSSSSSSNSQTYVGSVNSDVFHYPSCYGSVKNLMVFDFPFLINKFFFNSLKFLIFWNKNLKTFILSGA